MKIILNAFTAIIMIVLFSSCSQKHADLVLLNGKIVTVDGQFSIAEAVAISGDTIVAVGRSKDIAEYITDSTKVVELEGKTVVPGLNDSHLHPESAAFSELEEIIPDVHTVAELLSWIKQQASVKKPGEWIIFPKMFYTRLAELRQPTKQELDAAAPLNPVFLNGSFGGMINTAAMKASAINRKTDHVGIIKDSKGEPTGFIRSSAFPLLKTPVSKALTDSEREDALIAMLQRYNQYGITSICSASGNMETVEMFRKLASEKRLTTRILQNILIRLEEGVTSESIIENVKAYKVKTGDGDKWVRVGPLKIYLDGGILTGTAYLDRPWGDTAMTIFGIEDRSYRGVLTYSREQVLAAVTAANQLDWSFTAHCTGGGAVDILLDVFSEVNRSKPVHDRRFSVIHGNFFSPGAIKQMSEMGILANIQPAWFLKDADAMKYILGDERIKDFHPYKTMQDAGIILNGGSDHMVKWDATTSINPYNPFLAIHAMVSRTTEKGNVVIPQEAITREDALKAYTINNAYASFEEDIKGSIEPGKLADIAVLSDDILTCPVDGIRNITAIMTIVGGKVVYKETRQIKN